jgi:hypothetical protein
LALLMQGAEVILGQSVFLIGGALVPVHRPGGILVDTKTALVHHTDTVLRAGIALFRQRLPLAERGAIVAISRSLSAGLKALRLRRPSEQRQEQYGEQEFHRRQTNRVQISFWQIGLGSIISI